MDPELPPNLRAVPDDGTEDAPPKAPAPKAAAKRTPAKAPADKDPAPAKAPAEDAAPKPARKRAPAEAPPAEAPSAEDPPADAPADEHTGKQPAGLTPPSRRGGSRFLTEVIVEMEFVDAARVEEAVDTARRGGLTPESVLLDAGAITPDQLARATAERYGLDHIDLTVFHVDMSAANLISAGAARRYDAVPVGYVDDRTLMVAMADPANVLAVDDIMIMTGLEVKPVVASEDDIEGLIARLSRLDDAVKEAVHEGEEEGEPEAEVVELRESSEDAPVIKLVYSIVGQAVEEGASDIHFEPDGIDLRVRFRVDGVMQSTTTVPRRMVAGVVGRLKVMADLDISERRVPQDGRVGLTIENRQIDVRVVTLPSVHGESVVLRILDKEAMDIDLDMLGMLEPERDRFQAAFMNAYGAVLATGPTGSGKSTSLYAALKVLNEPEKNIITIEDPVEYRFDGITQVQVNPRAGLTFANGLRSMMRADPDIIMVGEIRDAETATIAIEAALTGHMVLSTLHTNDAPTAMTRLIEMGIEPFLVASAIDCVVAQRLARCLCSTCKKRTLLPTEHLKASGFPAHFDLEAYEPVGCGRCARSGYKGRVGLFEVMKVSDEIRGLVLERAPADKIAEVAYSQGMRRLRDDGLVKVKAGLTSIAEVARVTGSS